MDRDLCCMPLLTMKDELREGKDVALVCVVDIVEWLELKLA